MAKILIVFWGPLRAVYEKNFASWGHEVIACSNGLEAIETARICAFDLVVTDWYPPNPKLLKLFRWLKAEKATHDIPVVVISGRDSPDDLPEALKAGADDLISKPFSLSEVKARIERALARRERIEQLKNWGTLDDLSKTPHVFVSYVNENREVVNRLCNELTDHGVKIWLDKNNIFPGTRWKDAIREAITGGSYFIACFSPEYHSRDKTYMNEELILAIEEMRKRPSDRIWFIPVLLDECDIPARTIGAGETLLDIHWISLYIDWDAGISRILNVIKSQ